MKGYLNNENMNVIVGSVLSGAFSALFTNSLEVLVVRR